eukprot:13759229-Alexandrium_andersonii.AAC.1
MVPQEFRESSIELLLQRQGHNAAYDLAIADAVGRLAGGALQPFEKAERRWCEVGLLNSEEYGAESGVGNKGSIQNFESEGVAGGQSPESRGSQRSSLMGTRHAAAAFGIQNDSEDSE